MSVKKAIPLESLFASESGLTDDCIDFHRISADGAGNPWFVTTLWLAQYYIAIASNREELNKAMDIMQWAAYADHFSKCMRRR